MHTHPVFTGSYLKPSDVEVEVGPDPAALGVEDLGALRREHVGHVELRRVDQVLGVQHHGLALRRLLQHPRRLRPVERVEPVLCQRRLLSYVNIRQLQLKDSVARWSRPTPIQVIFSSETSAPIVLFTH